MYTNNSITLASLSSLRVFDAISIQIAACKCWLAEEAVATLIDEWGFRYCSGCMLFYSFGMHKSVLSGANYSHLHCAFFYWNSRLALVMCTGFSKLMVQYKHTRRKPSPTMVACRNGVGIEHHFLLSDWTILSVPLLQCSLKEKSPKTVPSLWRL